MTTYADAAARESGSKAKVFISYSRKDMAFAAPDHKRVHGVGGHAPVDRLVHVEEFV